MAALRREGHLLDLKPWTKISADGVSPQEVHGSDRVPEGQGGRTGKVYPHWTVTHLTQNAPGTYGYSLLMGPEKSPKDRVKGEVLRVVGHKRKGENQ